jgi:hypothetical protein
LSYNSYTEKNLGKINISLLMRYTGTCSRIDSFAIDAALKKLQTETTKCAKQYIMAHSVASELSRKVEVGFNLR